MNAAVAKKNKTTDSSSDSSPCAEKHTHSVLIKILWILHQQCGVSVSPFTDNTEKAGYCLFIILLLRECSEKYQGGVSMCVKASVNLYLQSSGLFLTISPDSYYFTATDKLALAGNINIICTA